MRDLFGKLPLQIVMIAPFVLIIGVTVALAGYLAFRNQQNLESHEAVAQSAIQSLEQRFGALANVQIGQQFYFELGDEPQLALATPYQDKLGLDWVIVVVIPEAGFMTPLEANHRTPVLLIAVELLGAIAVTILTARWVTQPVLRLNRSVKALAQGDWTQKVILARRDELGQLADSFNQMVDQLQASFTSLIRDITERKRVEEELKQYRDHLEALVKERTAELVRTSQQLALLAEIARQINSTLDLQKVLDLTTEYAWKCFQVDHCVIALHDETRGTWRYTAQKGLPPEAFAALSELEILPSNEARVAVLEAVPPALFEDIVSDPRVNPYVVEFAKMTGLQSALVAPMRVEERVLGFLALTSRRGQQRRFAAEEVTLVMAMADQVALALENARLYQQAQQAATLEERQRLARELHDSVTQSLFSITLLAATGQRAVQAGDMERVARYFSWLGETGQQALKEMRLLIYELRPPALAQEGLAGALQQRLDAVEGRAGVETRLLVEGEELCPAAVAEALYRIVLEALNNALKHSLATTVTVDIRITGEQAELEVADNGRGFDPQAVQDKGGMGLNSMRERAERLGGRLELISTPGQGTQVKVNIGTQVSSQGEVFS